ncbi:uncharacterized protein CDAR_188631 [Caerostris darwini]|uniref:Vitellogenin receptor n=1 Tax=Caerostris darwini TaxID=1538125 RepID=A0AAV4Q3Y6_9ARAC|nr:uncharacterized protein CDAR_188631 [Caerostris darwini]
MNKIEKIFGILLIGALITYTEVYGECTDNFECLSGKCINRGWFCDNGNDCGDNSDERYCNVDPQYRCPSGWMKCLNEIRCIPSHWICDNITDCQDNSDENNCANEVLRINGALAARKALSRWFLQKRLNSTANKWRLQLHRIAAAVHLTDDALLASEFNIKQEMTYELIIQLLNKLLNNERLNAEELALYVHALLVTCVDVGDFYGRDLVKELRVKVEETRNYTNPFLMLVLCNAGDAMTVKDVEKVVAAFNSPKKLPWTDVQALATMALACLSSRQNVPVDEGVLEDMLGQLKRQQFSNGSLNNFRTTALVVQALFIHDSYKTNFDLTSAVKILIDSQEMESSLLNAYYVLPVLSKKSLLNVTSAHCLRETKTDEEMLQKVLEENEDEVKVQYKIWIGNNVNLAKIWRLNIPVNLTVYDVIERISGIDKTQKAEYSVVDGKPYITSMYEMENDPQRNNYWFSYLRLIDSDEKPRVIKESPVDVRVQKNQEIILWYKTGRWSEQSIVSALPSN